MNTDQQINGNAAKIAAINDEFRQNLTGCLMTKGVGRFAPFIGEIFEVVRSYTDFNEDNDPFGEHDFGSFEKFATKFFWKIDYYDQNLKGWCDPLSDQCRRQMTIMTAEEY